MSDTKPRCQHIMASGVRCATPPIKGRPFCYHHRRLHDTYCLPGDHNYVPEPLDSPEAITLYLHHLELALNNRFITLKEYKVRLFSVQLAQMNMKLKAQFAPSPEAIVTEYTPAMRDFHRLNPNEPCSEEAVATAQVPDQKPLDLPCPVEWLQPPGGVANPEPNRLWYPLTEHELKNLNIADEIKLGTLEQEIQLRRVKLENALRKIPNPTYWQIVDANNQLDAEEMEISPDLYRRRVCLFEQLRGAGKKEQSVEPQS